jgi:hypothetical protein
MGDPFDMNAGETPQDVSVDSTPFDTAAPFFRGDGEFLSAGHELEMR